MTSMLAMTGTHWIMAIALFVVCVLLMLIVLVQKGRGGGLASAFGGGGGGSSAFGAKTGDVFTAITVVLAAVFLLLTVVGNYVMLPYADAAANASISAPSNTTPITPASGSTVPATVPVSPQSDSSAPAGDASASTETPPAAETAGDVAGDDATEPSSGEDNDSAEG